MFLGYSPRKKSWLKIFLYSQPILVIIHIINMKKDLLLRDTLKAEGFKAIDIDQIFNYLETLDYDLINSFTFVS